MPPISTSFLAKFSRMNTSEFVPWLPGSAVSPGMSITVNSGVCAGTPAEFGTSMNMCFAKRLCHACSVMIRTGRRYLGSAPA